MTKTEALDQGYCNMCAARKNDRWYCGLWQSDHVNCQLPDDVRKRWDDDMSQAALLRRKVKFGRGHQRKKAGG